MESGLPDAGISGARRVGVPLPLRLLGWVLIAVVAVLAVQLVGTAILGPERAGVLKAPHPRRWVAYGLAAFGAGIFLLGGAWRSRRDFGEFAGRMVLVGFSLGLAFLLGEVGLRVMLWRTQSRQSLEHLDDESRKITSTHPLAILVRKSEDPALIYELQPGLDREFGRVQVRTNSIGLRSDREYATARLPRSVRIVAIGDSGMFGWGVEQNEPYPAVLEANLNARGDGVAYEVLNFAVPGYNTTLEVECLRAKGLAFDPDIVLVGWCDNDVQVPIFVPQKGQWTRRDVSLLWLLLYRRDSFADIALSHVRTLNRDSDPNRIPEEVQSGSGVEGVRAAFRELSRLASANGLKVLVSGPMAEPIDAACAEAGLARFNTLKRIPVDRYPAAWSVHAMHPRPQGHAALAKEIEAELDRLGWLVPASR